MLQSCLDNIKRGVDPGIYAVKDKTKWYNINSKEQFFAVLDSLNNRGLREHILTTNLNNEKSQIVDYFLECEKEAEKNANKKSRQVEKSKKADPNQIDKSLFKCMEDYVEGSLRDQILDLEERIWIASFGNSKVEDRDQWRSMIEQGMLKLISNGSDDTTESVNNTVKEEATVFENGTISSNHMNGDVNITNAVTTNGDAPVEPMEVEPPVAKALPLHLKESVKQENNRSRCSTPVDDPSESEKIVFVNELSQALLQVFRFIRSACFLNISTHVSPYFSHGLRASAFLIFVLISNLV